MKSVEVIVIGQGLAGTTLAWHLRRRGRRVVVIDRENTGSSSRIAAGLLTPVTGKRLAKSWRWDELYPAALEFYRSVEAGTGTRLLHQQPAVRIFDDDAERDEYGRRAAGLLAGLVRSAGINPDWFIAPYGGFEMPHAARLDAARYLAVSRDWFRRDGDYRAGEIDSARDIELITDGVRLARFELEARAIAFCRGFARDADPWFGSIRFNAAKGEILTIRVPGLAEQVVHRGLWLAPVGGDVFRAGSTYDWDDLTPTPTETGRETIEAGLRNMLRLPYEVIDHHAAVRPVIDAGYPVLGRHPRYPQLAYFNGLGSKGALLAPFFAAQLAGALDGDGVVDAKVDVRRHLQNS